MYYEKKTTTLSLSKGKMNIFFFTTTFFFFIILDQLA